MKRTFMVVWCVLAMIALATATEDTWTRGKSTTQPFASGGTIRLHLGAGEATVVVKPGSSEIKVMTESKRHDKVNEIKVETKVRGTEADISVHGPSNGFRYTVEIPSTSNMKVRMSAGELNINGADGNLDIELHAGDCNIQLASAPENFGPVDLSVRAGDVDAAGFNASKGGLFRHFHEKRVAKYRLHAHVGAGDLVVK